MALVAQGRFMKMEKSRNLITVSQDLVKDSQFPFKHGDVLDMQVDPRSKTLTIKVAAVEVEPAKAKKKGR